jgi:hypothetical protein
MALLAGCNTKPPDATTQMSPADRLQAIAPADPAKYRRITNMKEWQNPYLVLRADGVALVDLSNNEERILRPDEVPDALAKLPASAWPYGRVVAVQENSVHGGTQDAVSLRRNRGILLGTLESMHVLINWVASA